MVEISHPRERTGVLGEGGILFFLFIKHRHTRRAYMYKISVKCIYSVSCGIEITSKVGEIRENEV